MKHDFIDVIYNWLIFLTKISEVENVYVPVLLCINVYIFQKIYPKIVLMNLKIDISLNQGSLLVEIGGL